MKYPRKPSATRYEGSAARQLRLDEVGLAQLFSPL
jgi:hypothetical protein